MEGRDHAAKDSPIEAPESDARASGPEHRIAELESRVEELTLALVRVDERVRELEGSRSTVRGTDSARVESAPEPDVAVTARALETSQEPAADTDEEAPVSEEPAEAEAPPAAAATRSHVHEDAHSLGETLVRVASIGGRTILILGGAFFLRALTESGVLPIGLGVPLALFYAAIWLGMGYRAAAKEPTVGASFYGLAFALIAYPMLAETTTLWHLLTPYQCTLALAVATGLGLFVAGRQRLHLLAWVLLVAGASTATAAVIGTKTGTPFMPYFVALGVGIEWLAAERNWLWARTGAAIVADLALLLYTTMVLLTGDPYELTTTLIQLSLFVAFMASYVTRSVTGRRVLTLFERLQASAVLLIGLVGAVVVARYGAPPMIALPLGLACVVLGLAGYAAAYVMFVVPAKNPVEAWFNTSYALVGVIVGSWLVLDEPAYAWMALSALLTLLGARGVRGALPLHGALCALLGTVGSGLLWQVVNAFGASATSDWPPLTVTALASLAIAALAYLAPLRPEARPRLSSVTAKTLALALLVAGLGGLVLAVSVGPLAGGFGAAADGGRVATLRTAILAAASLLLAGVSRVPRFREAHLLVYPILVAGGIKLGLEDFLQGRAITLTIGFLLYGVALVVAPRIKYRERRAPAPAS